MAKVTYEIIIKDGTGGGGGADLGGAGGSQKTEDMGFLGNSYTAYKAIKGFAPVAAAVSVATDLIQWQVSLVGRNMGSSLTQQKIDTGMKIAQQTLTAGGLLIGGLATGNPLLLLGAAVSAINTGIGYAKEYEQFNYDRAWENKALIYARERAGASYNRSRLV